MRGSQILFAIIALSLLLSVGAVAGSTANGCSYKVINGQYLTDCSNQRTASAEPAVAASAPAAVSTAPVTSYSDVPVRQNQGAYAPTLPPQQPQQARAIVATLDEPAPESTYEVREEQDRERLRYQLVDQTYVGVLLGTSNMKESNTSSTTGFGLVLGTNIDDHFGVELGYSYANQKMNLGLASSAPAPGMFSGRSAYDAQLSTHLFTGEIQGHLTDSVKRLRPYLGLGLGWRSASLKENRTDVDYYGQPLLGGSLRQNTFGAIAGAGTKLRVAKALNLAVAFRYFLPIARQDARLEQPASVPGGVDSGETRLNSSQDVLTGSSQYQVLGGVQYSF